MNPAKIQLSPEELLLVQNAELLLTKNRIIEKVYSMFGLLASEVENVFTTYDFIWPEVLSIAPKIFKGENYKGLPYVMLDYPRCFGKNDIFAIRTMFWWGNFFSTTLHLRGKYKNFLQRSLKEGFFFAAADNGLYLSVHADEWRHDFEPDNYISLSGADVHVLTNNIIVKDFCKISGKVPLYEWDDAPAKLLQLYRLILEGVMVSYPGDEKGL